MDDNKPGGRRMAHAELGKVCGISAQSAERIACDEAAGLRVALDARRTWGLRWALGRRR